MTRVIRFSAVFTAVATFSASMAFSQVNFAFDDNGTEPEIIDDGWDGEAIRIVFDDVGNSQNGVGFDNAVTGDYEKLEFDFEFRFLNNTPQGIADGLGFTYANVDIFGESAEDDGVPFHSGEEPNLEGSLGVGFDTWMNADNLDDPDSLFPDGTLPNSFSLHYDGQMLVTMHMEEYDLPDDWIETPSVKRAHVEIIPGDNEASVTVTVQDTDSGEVVTAFDQEPVPDFVPYDGRMTFRARTGGEWADTDVDNISLTHTPVGGAPTTIVHFGKHVGGDTGPPCDFDGDGSLGVGDIDLLSAEIRAGTNNSAFDVTGDGVVDDFDLLFFVGDETKLHTFIGDSNLDGEFNSSDLVQVFGIGEYEDAIAGNSGWADGDWNGDAEFSSSDLVKAFQDGGYEQGPKWTPPAAVPEPASLTLALLVVACLLPCLRRT